MSYNEKIMELAEKATNAIEVIRQVDIDDIAVIVMSINGKDTAVICTKLDGKIVPLGLGLTEEVENVVITTELS